MNGHEQLEINGKQPALEGAVCEEIYAVQYWHAGVLDEPVNAAHLKFGGSWHRLYFDHGIIYWRPAGEPPEAFEAPELNAEYRLHDIARKHQLVGKRLAAITCSPTEHGSRITLAFDGGPTLTFTNADDRTSYAC